jgi:hypothetical protein
MARYESRTGRGPVSIRHREGCKVAEALRAEDQERGT